MIESPTDTPATTERPVYTPDEVAQHRDEWVAALRNGHYQQGYGRLRTVQDGYCCLGVAEHVRGATFKRDYDAWFVENEAPPQQEASILTHAGAHWLGLSECDPLVPYWDAEQHEWFAVTLSYLNDSRVRSFAWVADVVDELPATWDGTRDWACEYRDQRRREAVTGQTQATDRPEER